MFIIRVGLRPRKASGVVWSESEGLGTRAGGGINLSPRAEEDEQVRRPGSAVRQEASSSFLCLSFYTDPQWLGWCPPTMRRAELPCWVCWVKCWSHLETTSQTPSEITSNLGILRPVRWPIKRTITPCFYLILITAVWTGPVTSISDHRWGNWSSERLSDWPWVTCTLVFISQNLCRLSWRPLIGWLTPTNIYLRFLQPRGLKSRCLQGSASSEASRKEPFLSSSSFWWFPGSLCVPWLVAMSLQATPVSASVFMCPLLLRAPVAGF